MLAKVCSRGDDYVGAVQQFYKNSRYTQWNIDISSKKLKKTAHAFCL